VLAHERSQDFSDRVAVVRGVLGDALQRVDTAQAKVELVAAQVVDRFVEPLGDLAFLV
jgi:hypothetical protein